MNKYLLGALISIGTIVGASGAANAQAKHAPAPGTIAVHLNGLVDWQTNVIGSSANDYNGYKLNSLGMGGYFRLYAGFDATTKGGLQYGADSELRLTYTPSAVGEPESAPNAESMNLRRAWIYIGTPQVGFVRVGQTNSPWLLLTTGEYYNWGDHNGWNSDGGIAAAVPSATHPSALFNASGVLYTTNKIVYISPNFAGFQAGISYEPNSNSFKNGEQCTVAAAGCNTVESGPVGVVSTGMRRNTVVGVVKYANKFGGFGVDVDAGYLTATPALSGGAGLRDLSVGSIGGQITFGGFLLGGNIKFGQVNNGYTFLRPGQRDLLFYNLTGEYSMGPARFAVNFFNNQGAGSVDRTQSNYGIGVGANYDLAKGVDLYAMYLYGHRHEAGYDFLAGGPGVAHNSVDANAFTVGTVVTW
ncbi:MAG TPA: porin [Acetobacteraceae bacterium]|nr:porin [Acetobacteraceae bacterium]